MGYTQLGSNASPTDAPTFAVLTVLPVPVILALASDAGMPDALAGAALAAAATAGALLLAAAVLSYVQWRAALDPGQGWIVAAVVLVSGQVFINAGLMLDARHHLIVRTGWPLVHESVTLLVILGLCVAALRTSASRVPDPMATGIALVLVAVVMRIACRSLDAIPPGVTLLLAAWVLLGHLGVGGLVLANHHLPKWARTRLAATVVLIGIGQTASLGWPSEHTDLISALATVVAGTLWAGATMAILRETLDSQRRRAASLEGSLLEIETASRGARERLHEVQSIVAGLTSATRLLDSGSIRGDVRLRLEHSIHAELDRLERLVTMSPTTPSCVDLDAVLEPLLQLQASRGRNVAWEPSGAQVLGRLDSVAEAVNILLENAASHGGDTGCRVAVHADPDEDVVRIRVSDQGPGIPQEIRDHVFDWGFGRADSPGQGIGLNLARRLVVEQGGTITLDEPAMSGSAFVIRLPAARRSGELHDPAGR